MCALFFSLSLLSHELICLAALLKRREREDEVLQNLLNHRSSVIPGHCVSLNCLDSSSNFIDGAATHSVSAAETKKLPLDLEAASVTHFHAQTAPKAS